MTPRSVFVEDWAAWAIGLETKADWRAWSAEPAPLAAGPDKPDLPFVDPLFRRRLSQLSRMAVRVGHEATAGRPALKTTFCSVYGEIGQQYAISARLVETGEVSPAAFSHSVFNAPVAALAIAEGNEAGYTAVYPGPDAFGTGLMEAAAAVLSGRDPVRLLIAADEVVPSPYSGRGHGTEAPHALALLLSKRPGAAAFELSREAVRERPWRDPEWPEPMAFLRYMLS